MVGGSLKLNGPGGELGQHGGGDGEVRGGGKSKNTRLNTGSSKLQPKLIKNNICVRGATAISHGRTITCTDEANTCYFEREKAIFSKQVVTSAIYLTEESAEVDGAGGGNLPLAGRNNHQCNTDN